MFRDNSKPLRTVPGMQNYKVPQQYTNPAQHLITAQVRIYYTVLIVYQVCYAVDRVLSDVFKVDNQVLVSHRSKCRKPAAIKYL